jgi:hypothetical protein
MEWASGDFVQKQIEKLLIGSGFTATIFHGAADGRGSSAPRLRR